MHLGDYLNELVALFGQTLNPSTQKYAENSLKQLEVSVPNFAQTLLAIISGNVLNADLSVRLAASLFFKNFVKRHWPMENNIPSLTEQDRVAVKEQIVNVLTGVPVNVQKQLCESITIIASVDFPQEWPSLLPSLVQRLDLNSLDNSLAILRTLHHMFKRYRTEIRSDELYSEINFVMSHFAAPMLSFKQAVDAQMLINASDKVVTEKLIRIQTFINKIFYSLSSQDIPAFFEENLIPFMAIMKKEMSYTNSLIDSGDDKPGPVEKLITSVAKIATLYSMRYEEEFSMLGEFVEAAWSVLINISRKPKDDAIAGNCMKLISTVARQEKHKALFAGVLQLLCDKIIVPNMLIRDTDLELFEDEPLEYLRVSVEGEVINEEGRREGAISLARGLMEFYEAEVTNVLKNYIDEFLKLYSTAPTQKWRDKNAAVNLFSAIAIKGSVASLGVTRVNPMLNIADFFFNNILPDLQPVNAALHPLLKVDAIRFLIDFRSQLDKQAHLFPSISLLHHHLSSSHFIVHSIAAVAIDKVLSVKAHSNQSLFNPTDIAPIASPIISSIITVLRHQKTSSKISENECVLKALLRILLMCPAQSLAPLINDILECLITILGIIVLNPTNPGFNHTLFECLAALIVMGREDLTLALRIEQRLVPVLRDILQSDSTDFIQYVFQLLAVLVEASPQSAIYPSIQSLIAPILQPALWSISDNIPALSRFLKACISKEASFFIQNNSLPQVLGIFQSLLSSKVYDTFAFSIIFCLIQSVPSTSLDQYYSPILALILKRLQVTRSPKVALNTLIFICIFVLTVKPSYSETNASTRLLQLFDSLQNHLLISIMSPFLLPQTSKVRDRHDRKIVTLGLTKLISECPAVLSAEYSAMFNDILIAIITLLSSLPIPGHSVEQSSEMPMSETSEEMSGSYWKLKSAPLPKKCPLVDSIVDPIRVILNSLSSLSKSMPVGSLAARIGSLPEGPKTALLSLLQQYNISL